MPGAWQRNGTGLDIKPGSFIEGGVLDSAGKSQGTIVLGVKELGRSHNGAPSLEGAFLGCSDPHYQWWMEQGEGKELAERCWYHLCGEKPGDCSNIRGKGKMIHLTKVRELSPGDFDESLLGFLKKKEHAEAFDRNVARFNRWVERRGEPALPGSAKPPVAPAKWHGSASSENEDEKSREESPQGRKLMEKLEDLRKELKKAEKQADDYRKAKKKTKQKSAPPKGDGKKRRDRRSRSRKSKGRRKRSHEKRSASRSKRHRSGRKDKSRSRRRRKRKKSTESENSGESPHEDKEALFQAKKATRSASPTTGDRGPFGEGPAVDYRGDDDSSSEESDFQKAPSKSTKSSQLKLLSYSRKYPGRLASRMLLKMSQATARGLEGAPKSKTPPVAMNHLLTVLQPTLQGKLGMRTLREMKTLAQCLDLLAQGLVGRGTDLLSQRLKALERATVETHWNSAQFLELLPPESSTLLERDEELYLAQEYLTDQRIKGYDKPYRTKGWEAPKGGGKGKESQKGEKGKGKDKRGREKEEK